MSAKDDLGSIFGKAKKWAQQELKNGVKFGGDPQERRRAEEENDQRKRQLEFEAKEAAEAAAIEAVLPHSVKDYRDYAEAERARRQSESEAAGRANRLARVTDSAVTLTGAIAGTATGLAIEASVIEDTDDLFVSVEMVDAVVMSGGAVTGFCFLIPGFHGDGTYPLVDHDAFDSLQYELYAPGDDNEGWGFHPSFGPGVIVVTDGVADVRLVLGGAGSDTIGLVARIELGNPT